MVKIKRIKRPTQRLVFELLQDIRKADFKELCMTPLDPYETVRQSILNSRYCYAARDVQHNLLAIFGLGSALVDVNGTKATPVWFLGTNRAYRHNKALVFHGKQFCRQWAQDHGPLCNFIWAGNEPAIRYIQHLGAMLLDVVPMGAHGEVFLPFLLKEVR